jgi:hypothetical protein
MPLNREDYEGLLNELLTPDLEAGRKTEILTSLRDHNLEYTTSYETLNKEKEKLAKDNSDLVIANSKLFRQTGVVKDEEPKKDEAKEFSQSITLEAIEQKLKK